MNTQQEMAFSAIARSLREFGYPDATADMVSETYDAMLEGQTGMDLPHGIVSMFAEKQIREIAHVFPDLPADA